MKRSQINYHIQEACAFFESLNFKLPPFAHFDVETFKLKKKDAQEILDLELGWDVTAFGTDDFLKTGLLLFTLRNGACKSEKYPKPYAEKIMMVHEGQITPRHFHWNKCEDIINRGGGNLIIEAWQADANNALTDEPFTLQIDGIRKTCAPGETFVLQPGESVCLTPYIAHTFYGEAGKGPIMVGEVSMVNDDSNDNCFIDAHPRFDEIEEDENPFRLISSDYEPLLRAH